jgi:hypothetical protein
LPTGNRPHAIPGVFIVPDSREVSPELNHGGQFAALLEHLTDGGGRGLVDTEHGARMSGRSATGKQIRRPTTSGRGIKSVGLQFPRSATFHLIRTEIGMPEVDHPVECLAGDFRFSPLIGRSPSVKTSTDEGLVSSTSPFPSGSAHFGARPLQPYPNTAPILRNEFDPRRLQGSAHHVQGCASRLRTAALELPHGHDPDTSCRRELLLGPIKERARGTALGGRDHERRLAWGDENNQNQRISLDLVLAVVYRHI